MTVSLLTAGAVFVAGFSCYFLGLEQGRAESRRTIAALRADLSAERCPTLYDWMEDS